MARVMLVVSDVDDGQISVKLTAEPPIGAKDEDTWTNAQRAGLIALRAFDELGESDDE